MLNKLLNYFLTFKAMYLLPIQNLNMVIEFIIIYDKNDLNEFMIKYVHEILNCDITEYLANSVLLFKNYLYYIPNEDKYKFKNKIKESELLDYYECINDKNNIEYIENNYEKMYYKYNFNIDVDIDDVNDNTDSSTSLNSDSDSDLNNVIEYNWNSI